MRITDEKIIESINSVVEAGHPDPIGFLARAEIKTGLDPDGSYKDAVGVFGVDKRQALKIGYSEEDLLTTDGNLMAAVDVDLRNLRKSQGDIDAMYRLSNAGGNASTDRFTAKLAKERDRLSSEVIFEDNRLKSLKKPAEFQSPDGETVIQQMRHSKSPSDISSKANAFHFTPDHHTAIDSLMNKLIYQIIDERPVNAIR